MTRLTARGLEVAFDDKPIIRDVGFDLTPGQVTGVVGPNGAGKSTLLRAICRLVELRSGQLLIDDADGAAMSRPAFAKTVAYLPQRHALHWRLEVRQVVQLGRLPHAGLAQAADDEAAIDRALRHADAAGFLGRKVDALSGSERARVMLARALAVEAPILLVDEPVAALDPYHALQIMEMLRELARQGCAVMIVLHDLNLAMRFCDRLMLLQDGRLIANGRPDEVLRPLELERAYRVHGVYGEHDREPYVVPWSRLDAGEEMPC